jgi:hypothetical protein
MMGKEEPHYPHHQNHLRQAELCGESQCQDDDTSSIDNVIASAQWLLILRET